LVAVLRGNLPQIKPFVVSLSNHERPFTLRQAQANGSANSP